MPFEKYIPIGNVAFTRMGLPFEWKNISEEALENLMHEKMRESQEKIKEWTEIKRATREIRKIKEELQDFQKGMLRNTVSTFGIFVAIFSFVIIGANVGLNIQLMEYIDLAAVFGILATVFFLLAGLLYVARKWVITP